MRCGECIWFQTQKQQQEPDTSLDGQMAKMASELFAVAVAYVPRSVANVTGAPLTSFSNARSPSQARNNKLILAAKQTFESVLASHVDGV